MAREDDRVWEVELRALVREEIKGQITTNTGQKDFKLMWARTPYTFIESQTTELLEECWRHFPAWRVLYSLASRQAPLSERWVNLDRTQRLLIARDLKTYFYRQRGLYT